MEISAATIRAYRERLELSQRDFAELLGVSQGMISLVELGRNPVTRKLLRALRARSEEGVLKPTFAEFLATGGTERPVTETEFEVFRPIPLELWGPRIDLRKPADAGVPGRFYINSLPEGARAYQFVPPPEPLGQDSVAVFRPARFADLLRGQIAIIQFRPHSAPSELSAGVAHLGRIIIARKKRVTTVQFEPSAPNVPVLTLQEDALEAVLVCTFRGRHSP